MAILVTGCAGFIGFHLAKKLIEKNLLVVGIDDLNKYYDVKLKKDRLKILNKNTKKGKFKFYKADISNIDDIKKVFKKHNIDYVVNLAAQAGVRYSIQNPEAYVKSNLVGFANILENCKNNKVKHLLYASTSSVYGSNTKFPYKEKHRADHPIQFYAATKRSNELMAHSYSHLFKLPTTGLRFFTVYGPWGRPDMALYKFTKNIIQNKYIDLYNKGNHSRSFTYIDDIVFAIISLLKKTPKIKRNSKKAPFRIINIGNDKSETLMNYVKVIEKKLNKKAKKKLLPLQKGDIKSTVADITLLKNTTKFKPKTSISDGISKFIDWYLMYNKKNK